MLVHLAILEPADANGMYRLLKWDAIRPSPDGIRIGADGALCEIDDKDLPEARTFCKVKIIDSKEVEDT